MRLLAAPLMLIAARARRRPGRWLLTALGVSLAAGFAGAVAAEGTIAGDQGARAVLRGLTPLDRVVRVTWPGPVTTSVERGARALLRGLGLGSQTEVLLLSPLRLGGIIVQVAAIDPLGAWVGQDASVSARPCRARACPVVLAGSEVLPRRLSAPGVRLTVAAKGSLRSAAPLGFTAASGTPLLLSGDVAGLDALTALSGVYRTHSWLAELPTSRLQSWQLAALERRLQRAQAALTASGSQFSLTAPFAALDAARAQASAAPRRLLLAGGGALAVLAAFIVLGAGGLRRDQQSDVERLRAAGARTSQCVAFVLGEAAWLSAAALLAGAGLAIVATTLLASAAGVPAGGVLSHSLITPVVAAALAGGWISATALVGLVLLVRSRHIADVLAVAAVAALALALNSGGGGDGHGDPLAMLLAPLCCLAAGVLVFRAAAALLRGAERVARRGPVMARLALVSLARAPAAAALAIAFIAVSTGLGAFALAYRSTLLRGTSDQAAEQVPLDVTVSPAADFTTPLAIAPMSRWRQIAGGRVLSVRRTYTSFAGGAAAVTVPALGVPAAALTLMHGWRSSDGSASLATLAKRLTPAGPVRNRGPILPTRSASISLRLSSPGVAVVVTAELRNGSGTVRPLSLGTAGARPRTVAARLPPGRWELEALQLDEPTGLAVTNGHQNGENATPATQFSARIVLGPMLALSGSGHPLITVPIGRWRAVGAASVIHPGSDESALSFATSGQPGILRPAQPSDVRPVPVLVDPQTSAASTRSGLIALSVDGLPVNARVVGVLKRFPTLPADAAGFVVADQATLSSALDAELPGQGKPDELWISTAHLEQVRAALRAAPLAKLGTAFRGDIEHRLRSAPIARGVLGALVAATVLSGALAALGLLAALLGATRDQRFEDDLAGQGVGPGGLRRELRLRLLIAAAIGVGAGLGVGVLLTTLAVDAVRAAVTTDVPRPSLVSVAPWGELAVWALVAAGVLALVSSLATRSLSWRGSAD